MRRPRDEVDAPPAVDGTDGREGGASRTGMIGNAGALPAGSGGRPARPRRGSRGERSDGKGARPAALTAAILPIATLVTEVVVVIALLVETRRAPGLRPLPRLPLIRALAAGANTVAAGVAASALLPWPVALAVVLVTYAGAVVALGAAAPGCLTALRDGARR